MEADVNAGIEALLGQASNYRRAKAAAGRFSDGRAALLAPAHAKRGIASLGAFEAPFNCDLPGGARKRTVLSRVGGKLMQGHSNGLCRGCRYQQRRPFELDIRANQVLEMRELSARQLAKVHALPGVLHEQILARSQGLNALHK